MVILDGKVLYPGNWSNVPKEARDDFESQWRSKIGSLEDVESVGA